MTDPALLEPAGRVPALDEDVLEPGSPEPAPHDAPRDAGTERYDDAGGGYDLDADLDDLADGGDGVLEAYTEEIIRFMDPHAGRVSYEPLGTYAVDGSGVAVRGVTTATAHGTNDYTLDATYDDPAELLYAGYHEALHGVMNNARREQEEPYGAAEERVYLFLAETLVPALSDRASYEHGRPVADTVLDAVDAGEDLAEVFAALDDDYTLAMVQFDVDAEGGVAPYDVAVVDADDVDDVEELYRAWEDRYGLPVDADASYEVDLSDADTDLLADLTERFVDAVDDRYAALYDQDAVLPPGAADRLYDGRMDEPVYGDEGVQDDVPVEDAVG